MKHIFILTVTSMFKTVGIGHRRTHKNYTKDLCTVWCCVSKLGIVGPYFFEEEGIAVTVTSARYVEMLNNFLCPELERRQVSMRDIWFQQDGATAHTGRASMAVVRQMFPGHVISKFGDVHWHPRSPDLSICDFFLWGYLKSKVYINKPRTLHDIKNSIRQEIEAVPNEMLKRAVRNFQKRIQIVSSKKDVISKTLFSEPKYGM